MNLTFRSIVTPNIGLGLKVIQFAHYFENTSLGHTLGIECRQLVADLLQRSDWPWWRLQCKAYFQLVLQQNWQCSSLGGWQWWWLQCKAYFQLFFQQNTQCLTRYIMPSKFSQKTFLWLCSAVAPLGLTDTKSYTVNAKTPANYACRKAHSRQLLYTISKISVQWSLPTHIAHHDMTINGE